MQISKNTVYQKLIEGKYREGKSFKLIEDLGPFKKGEVFTLTNENFCKNKKYKIVKFSGIGEVYLLNSNNEPVLFQGRKINKEIFEEIEEIQKNVEVEPPLQFTKEQIDIIYENIGNSFKTSLTDLQQVIKEIKGPQGEIGATGPQGEKGQKGNIGETGKTGATGATGISGPVGPQGPIGKTGPKGDRGNPGPKGAKGNKGPKGEKGDIGPQGPIGEKGPKGDIGFTGPAGPKGERGPKGEPGEKGEPGPKGEDSILNVVYPLNYDSETKILKIEQKYLSTVGKPQQNIIQSGGGGNLIVKHESVKVSSAAKSINFTGTGISSVSTDGKNINIDISGGGVPTSNRFSYLPTTPPNPINGDRWFNSLSGKYFVYIDDGDSQQWVEISTSPSGSISPFYNTVTISDANYESVNTDYYIGINHTKEINIILPSSPDEGKIIYVKDQSGNANTFNITIQGHGGTLIDGNSSITINQNYGVKQVIFNDGQWYII